MRTSKMQIDMMQKYVARSAASTSAVRGGRNAVPGVKAAARAFLSQRRILESLSAPSIADPSTYAAVLNNLTDRLRRSFPASAQSWGRARKLINIFIRDASYNVYLRDAYGLQQLEPLLELPIDSIVASRLQKIDPTLPRWKSVQGLGPFENSRYQNAAKKIAAKRHICRHFLDVEFWGNREI